MKRLIGIMSAFLLATLASSQAAESQKPKAMEVVPSKTATFKPIYFVPGVYDNGQAVNAGTATLVHCTSLASANQQIRYVERQWDGSVMADKTYTLGAGHTFTVGTHFGVAYSTDKAISPGQAIYEGGIMVSATSTAIFCTAMTIDASASPPGFGVELHVVRFNPWPGSME